MKNDLVAEAQDLVTRIGLLLRDCPSDQIGYIDRLQRIEGAAVWRYLRRKSAAERHLNFFIEKTIRYEPDGDCLWA